MIGVMLGLFAGVGSQPAVTAPAPPVIMIPAPITAPLPPLPEGAVPAVRATGNLTGLFTTSDYPLAALRNEEQGTVSFAVAIDRTGRVSACSITQSSGSASLDVTTCSIVARRARFSPSRDAEGRAIEDRAVGKIRWMLPPMPFADEKSAMVLTLNAQGAVTQCRVEGKEQATKKDQCRARMSESRAIAAQAGKRIGVANRELVLESGMIVGGPDAARGVGHGPGEMSFRLTVLALAVDATGTVTRCSSVDDTVDAGMADELCKEIGRFKMTPLDPAASDQSERHAVRYWATYSRPIG